jgi:hypothetical protein
MLDVIVAQTQCACESSGVARRTPGQVALIGYKENAVQRWQLNLQQTHSISHLVKLQFKFGPDYYSLAFEGQHRFVCKQKEYCCSGEEPQYTFVE